MQTKKRITRELSGNKNIEKCALRFGITGDKTRLKICYLLCHHPELSVSEIAKVIEAPVSTVSRSLKKLKKAGVVINRRESKRIFYSFEDNRFVSLLKQELLA